MIHRLIGLVLIAAVVIVGLSHYLSPDDLKDCNTVANALKSGEIDMIYDLDKSFPV